MGPAAYGCSIAGVGSTSTAELKECLEHLRATPVVRVVVNEAIEKTEDYYGY